MSDTEKAAAWLRDRMGEGWHVDVDQEHTLVWEARCWHGKGSHGGVEVALYADTPQAAAEAAWAAWQEATWGERAHADRLAEALRKCPAGYSGAARQWYAKMVEPALAAHDARRGKEVRR